MKRGAKDQESRREEPRGQERACLKWLKNIGIRSQAGGGGWERSPRAREV